MHKRIVTPLRAVLLLLALVTALSLHLGHRAPFFGDEDITSAVHLQMDHEGRPNTNMSTAGLPWAPAAQYNFSSYLLATKVVLAGVFALAPPHGDPAMPIIRAVRALGALMTGAAGLFLYLYARRQLGTAAAVTAAALFAVSPQIFSESLIARPEPFILLLVTASLYLTTRLRADAGNARLAVGLGVLQGLLVACKITLAVVAGQIALLAVIALGWPVRRLPLLAGLFALAAAAGFIAGLPYILIDLPGYVAGLRALQEQYAAVHLPFGRPFDGLAGRSLFALRLLADLNGGAVLLVALVGVALWIRRQPATALVLCGPAIALIGYFAVNPVLFERNFTHGLPVLFLAAGLAVQTVWQARPRLAALLALLLLAQPAWLWGRLAFDVVPGSRARSAAAEVAVAGWAQRLGGRALSTMVLDKASAERIAAEVAAEEVAALRIDDHNDPFTAAAVAELVQRHGFAVLERWPSPLADITQSELHAHHAHGVTLLAAPGRQARR
jgi:hypothetical protein